MRIYGQSKAGRAHREPQPAPELTCPGCGRKRPEADFLDGDGRRLALCRACREKLERAVAEAEARERGLRRCARCRKWKPEAEFADEKGRRRKTCGACRREARARKALAGRRAK